MESHLLQMRGLKHNKITLNGVQQVASFTDAWIETWNPKQQSRCWSHLLQMRGLKLVLVLILELLVQSHLLQMRGLKQTNVAVVSKRDVSHLLQMRGLKLVQDV